MNEYEIQEGEIPWTAGERRWPINPPDPENLCFLPGIRDEAEREAIRDVSLVQSAGGDTWWLEWRAPAGPRHVPLEGIHDAARALFLGSLPEYWLSEYWLVNTDAERPEMPDFTATEI
jgi:hypothetical protein